MMKLHQVIRQVLTDHGLERSKTLSHHSRHHFYEGGLTKRKVTQLIKHLKTFGFKHTRYRVPYGCGLYSTIHELTMKGHNITVESHPEYQTVFYRYT